MGETHHRFVERTNFLKRKSEMLANGYYTTVRNDGLVIARPKRHGVRVPVKGIAVLLLCFFVFKAFVLSSIGSGAYMVRLNILKDGTVVEQMGAWALGMDPVTLAIAQQMGPIFRG